MMNMLRKWFHFILEPHCQQCVDDRLREAECQSCKTLHDVLNQVQEHNRILINTIVDMSKPVPAEEVPMKDMEPIKPRYVPWNVRKRMLEEQDRIKAEHMKALDEELDGLVAKSADGVEKEIA